MKEDTKDRFYEELEDSVRSVNFRDKIILLGDLNGRVEDPPTFGVPLANRGSER